MTRTARNMIILLDIIELETWFEFGKYHGGAGREASVCVEIRLIRYCSWRNKLDYVKGRYAGIIWQRVQPFWSNVTTYANISIRITFQSVKSNVVTWFGCWLSRSLIDVTQFVSISDNWKSFPGPTQCPQRKRFVAFQIHHSQSSLPSKSTPRPSFLLVFCRFKINWKRPVLNQRPSHLDDSCACWAQQVDQ